MSRLRIHKATPPLPHTFSWCTYIAQSRESFTWNVTSDSTLQCPTIFISITERCLWNNKNTALFSLLYTITTRWPCFTRHSLCHHVSSKVSGRKISWSVKRTALGRSVNCGWRAALRNAEKAHPSSRSTRQQEVPTLDNTTVSSTLSLSLTLPDSNFR
jgi:hypothetical protein